MEGFLLLSKTAQGDDEEVDLERTAVFGELWQIISISGLSKRFDTALPF